MNAERQGHFWMVWNPQGRSPTKRHASEAEAEAEAGRLARQHQGLMFVVLQALYGVRVEDPPPPPIQKIDLATAGIDLDPF